MEQPKDDTIAAPLRAMRLLDTYGPTVVASGLRMKVRLQTPPDPCGGRPDSGPSTRGRQVVLFYRKNDSQPSADFEGRRNGLLTGNQFLPSLSALGATLRSYCLSAWRHLANRCGIPRLKPMRSLENGSFCTSRCWVDGLRSPPETHITKAAWLTDRLSRSLEILLRTVMSLAHLCLRQRADGPRPDNTLAPAINTFQCECVRLRANGLCTTLKTTILHSDEVTARP